jgi:hypothetical protein
MLTGRLPFVSTNAMELVRMHRDDPPPPVADFRVDVPARLESLVTAALLKDPAERPANGGALLRELRGAGGDATMMLAPGAFAAAADATQVLAPARPLRPRRKREYWLVPLVLLLLGGGVALALITTGGGEATQTTSPLTGLSLPTVATAGSTKPTTTAATEPTTTAPTTTARTTTHGVTTAPVTTAPVTPPPTAPTVPPATTVAPLPTTTAAPPPTTTAPPPTTTDTTPTTTAAPTTGP